MTRASHKKAKRIAQRKAIKDKNMEDLRQRRLRRQTKCRKNKGNAD